MSTWWIEEPILIGSSNPADADLEAFYAQGFRTIICLLDDAEQQTNYDVTAAASIGYRRHTIPILDYHAPTADQVWEFVRLVETESTSGSVLVHCQGGTGRTGTMAAAYWIAKGLSAEHAVAKVRAIRPHAVETDEQMAVLRLFEESLRKQTAAEGNPG